MSEQSRLASRSSIITLDPPGERSGGTGATPRPTVENPQQRRARAGEVALPLRCPYLAGRPPHGCFHLWPSSINVCYARPREEKPYSTVSKETQAARCFGGTEPFEHCPDHKRARVREIALPAFDVPPAARPRAAGAGAPVHRERVKRRH